MKKKIIFISSFILLILFIINSNYNNKVVLENTKKTIKKNNNLLSIMLETSQGSGEYVVSNNSTWPGVGYIFNTTLSKCENGSELSWDNTTKSVVFKGNVSDKCYVYFDSVPPSNGSISLNNNATYTTSISVTLELNATNASEMCISNTTSCSNWESYATSKSWTLTTGDGTKTVYVTYRNASGVTLGPVSDSIVVDGTAPLLTVANPSSTSSSSPTKATSASYTVSGTASDATSKLKSVTVNGSAATISGSNWSKTITLTNGATTQVKVVATDNAGKTTTITRYVKYEEIAKYWKYGDEPTYVFPNTPSITYSSVDALKAEYSNFANLPFYIKTTATEHQACLYYNNKEFCLGPSYWINGDTDGSQTGEKLQREMATALGISESDLSCSSGSTVMCSVSVFRCGINSDGHVSCIVPAATGCYVQSGGSASCGK